jgi:hypothetical protein
MKKSRKTEYIILLLLNCITIILGLITIFYKKDYFISTLIILTGSYYARFCLKEIKNETHNKTKTSSRSSTL